MTPLSPPVTPSNLKHTFKPSPEAQTYLHTPPYTPPPYTAEVTPPTDDFKRLSVEVDQHSRLLSDNELSYFLPSRQDGVNDMYLHHALSAPPHLMSPSRILHIWAYQLIRHPLLAAKVLASSYEDVSFVYTPPTTLETSLRLANDHLSYTATAGDANLISTYLNDARTLSSDRLAVLFVDAPLRLTPPPSPELGGRVESEHSEKYEVMLCATHYLGDGMALHTFMNEFYTLLGSDKSTADFATLIGSQLSEAQGLPASLEDRLPVLGDGSKLASAVGMEEYRRSESKLVGGQCFPGNPVKKPRHTVVPTFPYTPEETKSILAECKSHGVTIAHAIFALCNIAWARRTPVSREHPCLIYSALNLRPNMLPPTSPAPESFFHLGVGYFNVVLPTLLPPIPTANLFWHRARMTKAQTIKAVKSPFVVSRSRETSTVRRRRAVKWAKIDDEEEAKTSRNAGLGLGVAMPERKAPTPQLGAEGGGPRLAPVRAVLASPAPIPALQSTPSAKPAQPAVSQIALMGVSMLGNLDGMYKHKEFPSLRLESLTTGSRQRPGGLLLFAYTFAGKLWLSLGYDFNGFGDGVIEGFWKDVQGLVREVLL